MITNTVTLQSNPYLLPRDLIPVWEALGRPRLTKANNRWMGSARISPGMVPSLIKFSRPRDKTGKFSSVMIEDYANTMRRGGWLDDTDPFIWTESGKQAQGNHRLRAIEIARITLNFLVILGVPEESERQLGRVFGWSRAQLMGQDKQSVAIAVAGVSNELGVQTVARSFTPDVELWLEVFKEQVAHVMSAVGLAKDGTSRAGSMLAFVEGLVIDQEMNKTSENLDLFLRVVTGKQMEGCVWASLHKDYIRAYKGRGGGSADRSRDYHSTLYTVKRHLLNQEYCTDTRDRKPNKESYDATWINMSAGKNVDYYLRNFIFCRLIAIQNENPKLMEHVEIFAEEREQLELERAEREQTPPARRAPRSRSIRVDC